MTKRDVMPPARDGETPSDERRIDELLREFQMACEDAAEFNADSIRASAKHRAILRNELRSELLAVAALRAEVAALKTYIRGADRLGVEVNRLIESGRLSARSLCGDALLDYVQQRWPDVEGDWIAQLERAARSASGEDRNEKR